VNQEKGKHDIRMLSNGSRGNRLSGTLRASLDALKEHSSELVFKTRVQAVRSLRRARNLDRYTAHEHVMKLMARRLLRCEKLHMEYLQSRLEFVPAEAS
jgi:hypothetical protein